jgi:4-amino-4-deoxy-L-arabinose transferase-like glycosyltransferase
MREAIGRLRDAPAADQIHAAAVVFILIASIAPRVANLGNVLLYDEAVTYLYYTESPGTALTVYDRPNNHLLHSLLAYFSIQLFGNSEVAIRLPAFLASILGLWAVYRLGTRLFNRDVALWALALAGLAPWLLEYSYNARGYTLVVWLLTVALERLVRAIQDGSGLGVFETALVLAAFAVPTTVYFYAAVGIFAVGMWASRLLFHRGPDAKPLTISLVAVAGWTGLLYLNPFYWRWLRGLSLYPSDVGLTDLPILMSYLGRNLFAVSGGLVPPLLGVGVILIIFGSGAVWLMRTKPAAFGLILCVLLVPLGLVSVQALAGMNIPTPRALIFIAPVIYILASAGIYNLLRQAGRRLRRAGRQWTASQGALLSALVALAILGLDAPKYANQFVPYDQRADYQDEGHKVKEMAHYLAQKVGPGDSIFVRFNVNAQIQYYLPPDVVAAHWDITDETHRVFFVPGIWVTKDVFEQRYRDRFRFVGPVAEIGRDTIYLYERRDAP